MNRYKLRYKPLGSIAILIEWPKFISSEILASISMFRSKIHTHAGEFIIETVPAYNSLTVFFDTSQIKYSSMVKNIKELYLTLDKKIIAPGKLWEIPVCYDIDFGIDLEIMSKAKKISIEKIIKLHSSTIYDVHFIGFLPGFMYLGGLSKKIQFNRKTTPRANIKKGDVGIAGDQIGIYPQVSPGGWNIIGNSPLNFFDLNRKPPCFAVAGDKIKFIPINKELHRVIEKKIESGTYTFENKLYG